MKLLLACWSIVLLPLSTMAQPDDHFGSAACRTALAQLQQLEEQRRANRGPTDHGAGPQIERARRTAAAHCLGQAAERQPPRPARSSPPVSVDPVAPPPAPVVSLPPSPSAAEHATPVNRAPTTVTQCDSAGCWTSDGRYLLRVGPDLVGPASMCSLQAGLLQCR